MLIFFLLIIKKKKIIYAAIKTIYVKSNKIFRNAISIQL